MFRFCTTVWTPCRSLLETVLKLQLVANWNRGELGPWKQGEIQMYRNPDVGGTALCHPPTTTKISNVLVGTWPHHPGQISRVILPAGSDRTWGKMLPLSSVKQPLYLYSAALICILLPQLGRVLLDKSPITLIGC